LIKIRTRSAILALAMALSAMVVAWPAGAQPPGEFYNGKTIAITLGQPPGGSYDFYARLAADHLKRFIPGDPSLIVQHRPGGGGVAAVRWFYAQAPRDGTAVGLFSESIGHTQRLTPELGRVSRASPVQTAVRNCTRDEGSPFEAGSQVLASSHRKLLSSKAMVVSVAETPGQDSGRQG